MGESLSEDIKSVLRNIGTELTQGRDVGASLLNLRPMLHELAPKSIASCSYQIAHAATLYRRHEKPTWLERNFKKWLSVTEQLIKYPQLAEVLIFHFDGYIREKALQRLVGALPSAFICAAIVWRANDWVPQVRAAAEACAARTFPKTDGKILANAMGGILTDQESWGRWNTMPLPFQEVLKRPDVIKAICDQIISTATSANSAVFRYALKIGLFDQQLPLIFKSAKQPSLRALSFNALFDGEIRWPEGRRTYWVDKPLGISRTISEMKTRPLFLDINKDHLLLSALNDKSPVMRRAAMAALIRHQIISSRAQEFAQSMLSDRSKAVRERAQFILSRCAQIG
ncbi:hypothetical protein [Sphingorhabdus sp.]|uniref:hypothetical protein n=1 Tax=Sphingorhabdus sp. TaxID=1902408 RepID=UPI003BAE21A3|nr:hypothetical protein [Sphingomonadales bacterium]